MTRWWRLLPLAALTGCATGPNPFAEDAAPADVPSVAAVRADAERYRGQEVRWGGTIARVMNRPEETCLEVVATDLERGGRPEIEDRSAGRFIGCIDRFLDPAVYAEGRELTVIGTVAGVESGLIDQYRYQYPLVDIQRARLWEPEPVYAYRGPPYWNDPVYGFYPYWW